jgi:hypothetical protein
MAPFLPMFADGLRSVAFDVSVHHAVLASVRAVPAWSLRDSLRTRACAGGVGGWHRRAACVAGQRVGLHGHLHVHTSAVCHVHLTASRRIQLVVDSHSSAIETLLARPFEQLTSMVLDESALRTVSWLIGV